ncbi:MAG: leucine--tRNA ligase [Deltaproteobacteria bacterium]|nr:leucine--tRNA ligase [Deltaproteobacteria bacterium]
MSDHSDEQQYDPATVEARWQAHWEKDKTFAVPEEAGDKPKFYMLEMFPYPSGKLHMGHVRNYSIGDVMARFKRARGFDVLHPMGWDAFGLPAENAAIKRGVHPADWTYSNIAVMRRQLQRLGFSYDWDRELATCDASYYRWEQAVFLDLLEKGLAYKKGGMLNWCESCQTVLANEQVDADGNCWRCGNPVIQKELEQWYLRITDYAQELLDCLGSMDGWPNAVTTQQVGWIGRSTGASIRFALSGDVPDGSDGVIEVFTTRPDTLYGCTFMSLAPEHPLTKRLAAGTEQEAAVNAFVDRMGRTDKADRTDAATEKEGVFVGRYAINPVNGREVPIYTANFVLADYGTGAVMAVPAHDQRDFEFATKYGIDKVVVIDPPGDATLDASTMTEAFVEAGTMVNSGTHDGTANEAGKASVIAELEEKDAGKGTVNFRLRDWGISRQRYWGAPVPVIYCDVDGMVPVPKDQLPVVLPKDVQIGGEGGSPLARHEAFWKTTCPTCGGPARRETDTMDTFMESSWYFMRYCSPHYEGGLVDPAMAARFLPVDMYVGGIEHAVMHLLYARFYTKILRDLGHIPAVDEPFTRLVCQGMVNHESYKDEHGEWVLPTDIDIRSEAVTVDGKETVVRRATHKETGREVSIGRIEKMSKSKLNTVDPETLIAHYGADTMRLFCLFASPPTKDLEWSDAGVEGASRFIGRVWRLVRRHTDALGPVAAYSGDGSDLDSDAVALRRAVHQTIVRVTVDVEERLQLNTAIAAVMELVNTLYKYEAAHTAEIGAGGVVSSVMVEALETVLRLLSPFAPHFTNELWEKMGRADVLEDVSWPEADASAAADDSIEIVVQIKGKKRASIAVAANADQPAIEAAALAAAAKWVGEAPPRRVIYVPGRLKHHSRLAPQKGVGHGYDRCAWEQRETRRPATNMTSPSCSTG